ncbi:PhzF family phenazine biosynthesis protein [Seonamhaeicola marinus]|uniref:PhzF family phenazine biosynthesis protein n=1 Tax=Seonamhaeicola marinus TaxID=1912246 RepID=A0A5D0HET8_9FLAO|nr:PhzF family phenazine biosynthesis isomerase [Seonamhaeicola marinus]TYA69888.1 PhzF family phenazine biosynthesis protein [Seonamhaeicola marinus]
MRLFTVDSFTDTPFKGNPAAVCVLDNPLSVKEYIDIAQEMNLSETAFVYLENGAYQLRWFTPEVEIDLCGHATLATAKILFEKYEVKKELLEFNTKSGVLTVRKVGDLLEMNFPIGKMTLVSAKDGLIEEVLGQAPIAISEHKDWYLLEFETEEQVRNLKPNFSKLLEHDKVKFIVTSKSTDNNYDFVSRFFAPAAGINEDPVTGSAHCYLADYWSYKLEKNKVIGYQASKRGGIVECKVIENDRVLLRGDCVVMSEVLIEWVTH